ncbi:unnamed protein product, partial [Prorocentrum cordatum]
GEHSEQTCRPDVSATRAGLGRPLSLSPARLPTLWCEDRPDPFWANRGEVGVPGLGLLDDKMSVGSLPPPTLNRHGEAQSRGATAKLIASSISRAVKQAEQGERPGQRQAPQAKGPVMARHQWESVLGEEEPAGRQAKASSGSAAGRAARNVSQIAATSRDRSRSRFPGS